MKTTLDLPEELVREMKIRAAREGRKLRDVATEIIQRGIAETEQKPKKNGYRVKLPLIRSTKVILPEDQPTPEKIDEILLNQEIEWLNENNDSAGR
jgi:plasmid stability protein